MPPRRGSSPSVDPFPPLRREPTRGQPSYATIAARHSSHPHRDETEHAWASEDVDRHDSLDELNPYNANLYLHPSPPWRSRAPSAPSTAGPSGEHAPAQADAPQPTIATPSGAHQPRANAVANGARNPASREQQTSTPTAGPSRPRGSSPPTPSPHRAARQEPERRLAPIFTLEELLGDPNPSESTAAAASATTEDILADFRTRRRRRALASAARMERDERRMEQALPTAADEPSGLAERPTWAGGLAAAQRGGYASLSSWLFDSPIDPVRGARTMSNQTVPLDGSGGAATSFLRRRRQRPGTSTQIAYDPDEVLPASAFGGADLDDPIQDEDSDADDQWGTFFRHNDAETEAEFDVDGLGSVGNDGVPNQRASLTRGGNNRRRRSFLQRIGAPPDLRFVDYDPDFDLARPPARADVDAPGRAPTNQALAGDQSPFVVRTGGLRRARERDGLSNESRTAKRVKANKHTCGVTTMTSSNRPNYLLFSTLPVDTPLPCEFTKPLPRSHLSLSLHYSAQHDPRPLVTFTGCNPTYKDYDATALRTTTPIPLGCGVHYYEVQVVSGGEEGFMSVGWMSKDSNLRRLVGWDKGSWGWHGDDGRSFEGQGRGERFSETWTTNDVVGCGVDFTTGRAFFTKNGKMMGYRFSKLAKELYPAVGLRTLGESIAVNFTGPFEFDIEGYVRDLRDTTVRQATKEQEVIAVPRLVDQVEHVHSDNVGEGSPQFAERALPKDSPLTDTTSKVTAAFVLDHLKSNGHAQALSLLRGSMAKRGWLPPPSSSSDRSSLMASSATSPLPDTSTLDPSKARLADFPSSYAAIAFVRRAIADSHGPFPWEVINQLDPSASISQDQALTIRICVRHLLHLIHVTNSSQPASTFVDEQLAQVDEEDRLNVVIEKGRDMLQWCKRAEWSVDQARVLHEAFGMLGASDNEATDRVWAERRVRLADDVVLALKRALHLKPLSHLQQAVAQSALVLQKLREKDGKTGAAFIDLEKVVKG